MSGSIENADHETGDVILTLDGTAHSPYCECEQCTAPDDDHDASSIEADPMRAQRRGL